MGITSIYGGVLTLRLPKYSFPEAGFQYKFDANYISYYFDAAANFFVISMIADDRKWELRKDSCEKLLEHFLEQIAQIHVNQDSDRYFWKHGKCYYCNERKKLYYVKNTRADEIDAEFSRFLRADPDRRSHGPWWGSKVFWICKFCIKGRDYVRITSIANNAGGKILEPLEARDK